MADCKLVAMHSRYRTHLKEMMKRTKNHSRIDLISEGMCD